MREVFVHQDTARVGHYKSILDANGITSFIRNELSNNSLAEMPAGIFFPALCVVNDDDYERALELLRAVHKPEPNDAPDWKCGGCGEEVPGTFDHCWKCGAAETEKLPAPQQAADSPHSGSRVDLEKTLSPESLRRIASVFRWLVIANLLLGFAGIWIIPQFECRPPEALKEWVLAHDGHSERLEGFAMLASSVEGLLWVPALVLCFLLWNPGRFLLLVVLGCEILVGFGFPCGVYPRWVNGLSYFRPVVTGALIALAYLSPLQVRFSSKTRGN